MASNLALTRHAYLNAVRSGAKDQITVLNVSLFAALYNYDLAASLEELDAPVSEWHERLHARVIVLTVYECLDDLPALLGKDFRAVVEAWDPSQEVTGGINALGRRLRAFRNESSDWLKEIRRHAIGHRHQVAMGQLRFIENLDLSRVFQTGMRLLTWTTDLYSALNDLIGHRVAQIKARPMDA